MFEKGNFNSELDKTLWPILPNHKLRFKIFLTYAHSWQNILQYIFHSVKLFRSLWCSKLEYFTDANILGVYITKYAGLLVYAKSHMTV